MLYSLTKIVLEHPYLPITATSPQRPLSFVPKVADVERFVRLYRQFRFLGTRGFLPACEKTKKRGKRRLLSQATYIVLLAHSFFYLLNLPISTTQRGLFVFFEKTSGQAVWKIKLLPPQSPRGFSALARLYYLAHPKKNRHATQATVLQNIEPTLVSRNTTELKMMESERSYKILVFWIKLNFN